MKNSYDSLNDTFNTDPVESTEIVKEQKRKEQIQKLTDDVSKDYDYTRGNLYSLIEKGQEAINGIMEVAGETASPRAYEVAGQLIKSVADTTDKLMDLQKKVKEVEEDTNIQDNNDNIADIFEGGDISIDNVIREAVKDSIEDWFSRNLRPIVEESVKQEISKLFKKRN